jgi:hypothetical protein
VGSHPSGSSKRRYRSDKLFHHTHSLNRQYIVTMTNILFQMQKDIYKLKRRTQHVEQALAKQTQAEHPIIRIRRLTKGMKEKGVFFYIIFFLKFKMKFQQYVFMRMILNKTHLPMQMRRKQRQRITSNVQV